VVGLVTDAELLDRLTPSLRPSALRSLMHRLPFGHPKGEEVAARAARPARRASDLMSRDVVTATEDALLSDAIAKMLKGSQKVLAVTDREGRLVGMVDRADLLQCELAGRSPSTTCGMTCTPSSMTRVASASSFRWSRTNCSGRGFAPTSSTQTGRADIGISETSMATTFDPLAKPMLPRLSDACVTPP
jgi:hypothetical protein